MGSGWSVAMFPCSSSSSSFGSTSSSGPEPYNLDNIIDETSKAICGALMRCCNQQDQIKYFANYHPADGSPSDPVAPFESRLPPNVTLDESSCIAVLNDIFPVIWLGDWVSQARDNLVTFNAHEAGVCLRTMKQAPCGPELKAALYDDGCFAKKRTHTGPNGQRRMFDRTRTAGQECRTLADGLGGTTYGSCDPNRAFCCVPLEGEPQSCKWGQVKAAGTCKTVSAEGTTCSLFPSYQSCATGFYCDSSNLCAPSALPPLSEGQVCWAEEGVPGECVDSYCDMDGDNMCHALKQNGEPCGSGEECESGDCISGLCNGLFCTAP